jgi:hypothetical protein
VHRIEFRQIVRDAEIAYAISPVVRKHCLTEEKTKNSWSNCVFLARQTSPESRIVRSFNRSQSGELRTRDAELIEKIAPLGNALLQTRFVCRIPYTNRKLFRTSPRDEND